MHEEPEEKDGPGRWNVEAEMPGGPGSDASYGLAWRAMNWLVKLWRGELGNRQKTD